MTEILMTITDVVNLIPLAQADGGGLIDKVKEVIKLIRIISYVLAVGSLIASGISFALGKTDSAIFGAIAAGILGIAPSIAKFVIDGDGELDL